MNAEPEKLDPCAQIAESVGYSAHSPVELDSLIDYKNALEDALRQVLDGQGEELSEEARALIAACVADSETINDPESLTAPPETWEEVRAKFPISLYHDSRIVEGGIA